MTSQEQTIPELWRGEPWPKELLLLDNDFFGNPILEPGPVTVHCTDPKGGDPEEWPADLRVREFPR